MSWEAWGDPPEPPEMVGCEVCEGKGTVSDGRDENDIFAIRQCQRCQGTGEVEKYPPDYDDYIEEVERHG